MLKKLGFGCMRQPLLDKSDQTAVVMETFNSLVDTFLERGFRITSPSTTAPGGRPRTISPPVRLLFDLVSKHGKAEDCIECRACAEACPQHLEISQLMKDVSEPVDNEPGLPTR